MRSQTLTLGALWKLGRFVPARVQRGYRWVDQHQQKLLSDFEHELHRAGLAPEPPPSEFLSPLDETVADLDEADFDDLLVAEPVQPYRISRQSVRRDTTTPRAYFLGHMVAGTTRAEDLFYVYDGQQRLTTIAVLLAALRDRLPPGPSGEAIRACLLHTDGTPRLAAPTPGGALKRITGTDGGTTSSSQSNDSSSDHSLRGAASRFVDRLTSWDDAKAIALLDFVLDRVFVTVTLMDDRRLAETAYMTVNTRGLSLDTSEVLKGHLVQVVSDVSHTDGLAAATQWDRIRRQAGPHMEGLIRTVGFKLLGQAHSYDLGVDLIDQFPDGPEGAEKAKDWIHKDLPRYWETYDQMVRKPPRGQPMRGAPLELRELGFLPWDEWRSIALHLFEATGGAELAKRLRQLKQSCYTLQLLGWAQHEERRRLVMTKALAELEDGLSPFRKRAQGRARDVGSLYIFADNKRQARAALMAPLQGPERYRPIAKLAEMVLWLEADLDPAGFVGDATVEHVLPMAPRQRWDASFPKDVPRERLKCLLGNLCMIPYGLNQDLGTATYAIKRDAFLRLKPTFRSAHDVASFETWTPDAIHKRTLRLAQRVAKHLGLPQ